MAVEFVDRVMAYVAASANQAGFVNALGLAGFAATSLGRRYAQGNYEVDGVTLGPPEGLQLQESLQNETNITGWREKRGDNPERYWYDVRFRPGPPGWADIAFTVSAQMALRVVPGSVALGMAAGIAQGGEARQTGPSGYGLSFRSALETDPFTLKYVANTYIFVSSELSPRDDLRRIQAVRTALEASANFLSSLDGSPNQRPFLFVQVYPSGASDGTPLASADVVRLFDAADVLAAFFEIPGS
jgi:hypothetical protein